MVQWVKAFWEGRDAVQDNLRTGRPHVENNTDQLIASLLGSGHQWTAHELAPGIRRISQNCVLHSTCRRHSGLPQTCSSLDTPWTTMALICSRTGLTEPVSKGRWGISWTNRRYGRNLCSLIRTNLETPIKWMEASLFSSSYTMCCEDDVQCGL